MRQTLLILLAVAVLTTAGLRALGSREKPRPSPREVAERVLAETSSASAASAGDRPLFVDVAPAMGLDFVHDNAARGKFRLPEIMGPGAAFLDYDGDGDLDVFVAGGGGLMEGEPGQTCRLFRSDGQRFTDVSEAMGADVVGPAYGVACADYDDDGDVDIYITRMGANALLRNDGSAGFAEIGHEAGVADPGFGASAAFLDYDRDGRLDLYVSNYVNWTPERETPCFTILGVRDYCGPLTYQAPSTDVLYRGTADGTFIDVSEEAGIAAERGNGLGVLVTDVDDDGWADVYVATDLTPAFLWHNQGDGTFRNVAAIAGCAYDARGVAIAGMGTAGDDLDGDGDIDLLVTNIHGQTNLVLRNDGGVFQDTSLDMGMGAWSIPATSFGVVFFDQDHDGALDAFIANGDINLDNPIPAGEDPYAQPDQFVRLVDGRFVDETPASGAAFGDVGRGVASGDIDGDGDIDLLVTNNGGPVRLLRNEHGQRGGWLIVDPRTGPGRRAAIGARLTLVLPDRRLTREIRPQQSYLCSGDPRAHFGLGAATRIERLEIRWPDGRSSVHRDLDIDRVVVIDQPAETTP